MTTCGEEQEQVSRCFIFCLECVDLCAKLQQVVVERRRRNPGKPSREQGVRSRQPHDCLSALCSPRYRACLDLPCPGITWTEVVPNEKHRELHLCHISETPATVHDVKVFSLSLSSASDQPRLSSFPDIWLARDLLARRAKYHESLKRNGRPQYVEELIPAV